MSRNQPGAIARELRTHIRILGGLVALLWGIEFLDLLIFQNSLDRFGIRPHSIPGLSGILFAPFLHRGIGHLIANTIPLVTLGWLIMLRETSDFLVVTGVTMLVSGLGTWLFGSPNSIHVGASGLVFGYFGFLLLRGYFERSVVSIALSLVVGVLYGSLIWGILPSHPSISWQGHLFGFLGGVLAARFLAAPESRSP